MRRRTVVLLLSALAAGCEPKAQPTTSIELLPPGAESSRTLTVSTALAEYVEVPGIGHMLTVTLSNYDHQCDRFVPPQGDQVLVSVTVETPPSTPPIAGIYPWRGHDPERGPSAPVQQAQSVPNLRLPGKNLLFEPGGGLQLTAVSLSKHGAVSGLLAYQFSGDAERGATRLAGPFSAKICSYDPYEKPRE